MRSALLASTLSIGLSLPAAAATFTDEAAFLAAVPGTTAENFETATFDGTTIEFAGGTITCSGGTFCTSFFGLSLGGGFALSGANAPFFGTPDKLVFSFTSPITAFGIFIGGAGDVGVQDLIATLSDGTVFDILTDYANGSGTFVGNTNYFGVTNDSAFTSVTFSGSFDGDGVFFDDMRYGGDTVAPIPVPASALFLLAGLGALAGLRRRS
jgi:hypothetical protein